MKETGNAKCGVAEWAGERGESAKKSRAPGEGCAARKFRRKADYFLASMAPAPPHFSQFLLSLAAATQHA
jgi:hypothetical protein